MMTDPQRAALLVMLANHPKVTYTWREASGKDGCKIANYRAAESLVKKGLARWWPYTSKVVLNDDGIALARIIKEARDGS